jgi:hypothetical protein
LKKGEHKRMEIIVRLTHAEENNARLMAIQHKKTVKALIQETVSGILSGEAAYIMLVPAPPTEVLEEVREAVNRVINKEKSFIYVPDPNFGRR